MTSKRAISALVFSAALLWAPSLLRGESEGRNSASSDICSRLSLEAEVLEHKSRKGLTVALEFKNAGAVPLYLLDDSLYADPFQVRTGVLWYDTSADSYLATASVVLSTEHLPKDVSYRQIRPGDSLRREVRWKPRNKAERKLNLRQLIVKVSFTDNLPAGRGNDFVEAFRAGPSSCTKEVPVSLEPTR